MIAHAELINAIYEIVHITEGTCLRAVAINSHGFAFQGLSTKSWNYATIVKAHARTIGIKNADHTRFEIIFLAVDIDSRFRKTFRFVVTSAGAKAIYVAPVCFPLRVL